MDKLTMGDRIREARKHKGLTQERLAELLDISVESVSHIERGSRLPKYAGVHQAYRGLERICRLSPARLNFRRSAFW